MLWALYIMRIEMALAACGESEGLQEMYPQGLKPY